MYKDNKGGVYAGPHVNQEKYRIKIGNAGTEGTAIPDVFEDFGPFTFYKGHKYLITIKDNKGKPSLYLNEDPPCLDYYIYPEDSAGIYFNNETKNWYGIKILFWKETDGLVGQWAGPSREGNIKEVWTISHGGAVWKVSGKYYSGDTEVGSFTGENVSLKDGKLYFRQIFSSIPVEGWAKIYNIEAKQEGNSLWYKWDTGLEEGEHNLKRVK